MHRAVRLLLAKRSRLRRRNIAGSDRVALNVVLAVLRADVLGQHLQAALCRRIRGNRLTAKLGHHRAGVDDFAASLFDHPGQNCFGANERSCQINIDNLIPLCFCHLDHRNSLDDARIVDQNVNCADLLFYVFNKSIYLLFVRYIADSAVSIDAFFLVSRKASVNQLLIDIIENNLRANFRKRFRIRKAKAVGCACDPCYFAIQSELIDNSHRNFSFQIRSE